MKETGPLNPTELLSQKFTQQRQAGKAEHCDMRHRNKQKESPKIGTKKELPIKCNGVIPRKRAIWNWGKQSIWHRFQKHAYSPGSVDWVLACEPKGRQFGSHSGHMPRLWAWSPVRGMWEETEKCVSHTLLFFSLSFSLPSPLSKGR